MLSLNLGVAIFREGAKNAQAETKKCDAKKCTKKVQKSAHKKMHRNKFQLGAKMQNMHVHFPPTLLSLSHVNLEMPSSV